MRHLDMESTILPYGCCFHLLKIIQKQEKASRTLETGDTGAAAAAAATVLAASFGTCLCRRHLQESNFIWLTQQAKRRYSFKVNIYIWLSKWPPLKVARFRSGKKDRDYRQI